MLDHISNDWQLNTCVTLNSSSHALIFSCHFTLSLAEMTISYFVFLLKHPLCLPSSSHLVYHLAFYSTGESSKNRSTSTLSYKQSHYASGPMLPSCPHFQMMNFPCGKIWRTSLFVCWIPVLLVCSGIFLEFALLISLHNHCFSSQFVYFHHYSHIYL